ncbi:hypothetical protein DAMA08_013870 [Martiniozyma asiatica (nom. inval.)]|nr:hypothetical protein DAMA08_013870 [Martiniozyma asiatica]
MDTIYTANTEVEMARLKEMGAGMDDVDYLSSITGLGEGGFFQNKQIEKKRGILKKIRNLWVGSSESESSTDSITLGDLVGSTENLRAIYAPQSNLEPLKSCIKSTDANANASKSTNVKFCELKVDLGETWSSDAYDRFNPDMRRMYVMMNYYPREMNVIKREINDFKKEMEVHENSIENTHFLLV